MAVRFQRTRPAGQILAVAAAAYAGILTGCARDTPSADIVIQNVTLIDGMGSGAVPDMSVAVRGGRIVAVGPSSRVSADAVAVIDGSGKYLIPGLWDMHVHFGGWNEAALPLFLANGVTSVRDMGGDLQSTGWVRQETRFGRLLGPRVLIAGPVLDAPLVVRAVRGTRWEAGRAAVADSSTAVAMVDSLSRVGVDHLKVHSMTPRAAYFAILREAARRGMPVVGHIPDSVLPEEAIDAGQRTIEHDFRIAMAGSPRAEPLTRAMLGRMDQLIRRAPGGNPGILPLFELRRAFDDSARRSYDLELATAFGARAAQRAVWFTPTLIVLETMLRRHEPEIRDLPETRYAPSSARIEDGLPVKPNPTRADIEAGRRAWDGVRTTFASLVRAGARFVAGTDVPVWPLVPGFSLHRELERLVQIGLTPEQAILAASRNAAEAAGQLDDVGTVTRGKRADLLLLDADPLADIANTRSIAAVVVGGRLLDRATLDRMLIDAEALARQR